jgi:putative transposase
MDLVEELDDVSVPITLACEAVGVSRATLYRNTRPPAPLQERYRAPSPRRLSDTERVAVLEVLHGAEFVDQPPQEVFGTLLSRGVYLASIRTMYRLLAEHSETKERRNQRRPQAHVKPSLRATAPNQVWTWDITKLATTSVGVFLHAYVIIDLFSRYVVGWMVATKECKHLAAQLFAETVARHGVEPGLTVHADRGAAMKSDTLAQLLATLGVQRSFSRPHVSDDNAFSEAHFKTLKYQPDYPGSSMACCTHVAGSSPSSAGTTTSIITRDWRCSPRRMSSSTESTMCVPCGRTRSMPCTPSIPSGSPKAPHEPPCHPRRSTLTR